MTQSSYVSFFAMLPVCAIHYQLAKFANQFYQAVENAGREIDVPWLTNFLLHNALVYWIIPLFIACFILLHHLGYLRRPATVLVLVLGTVVSLAISIFGIYLPLIQVANENYWIR